MEHEVKVRRCFRCPMLSGDLFCSHPKAPEDHEGLFDYDRTVPPDWCPLRRGPLVVRLVEGE